MADRDVVRYAIYAIPGIDADAPAPARELRERAEAWFARDDTGDITVSARRYGFHGTLSAPFRLADGLTEADVHEAAERLASGTEALTIPGVSLERLGSFHALTPTGNYPALQALADSVVRTAQLYRAQLTDSDIQRRRPEQLSARQRELLYEWGYPYVFDEFRFHLTLTDAVADERQGSVSQMLEQHFADVVDRDIELTALSVLIEPGAGQGFAVQANYSLAAHTSVGVDQEAA